MKTTFSKIMAILLALVLVVSAVPPQPASAAVTKAKFELAQLDIVSNKETTLAPGVTENQYTVFDKNGAQVKMFVATADMNVDSVKAFASYKDMNPTDFGMSKLTEQVAAFNEKAAAGDAYYQGTVVAGINASYYNMTTGQPTGIFVMNGIAGSETASAGYFAILKDGTMKIAYHSDYAKDKGNIQEAIGIYTMLVADGKICSGLDAKTKYPRQTIGITADNKLIIMSADGNQAPTSVGLTIQEQAQVMLDLGCVWAGHLDGGGSMTYGSKPEGSDKFQITNSPSDGSERSVSNGFIIVSTAVASYEFDHVTYGVESEYVTPGTSVAVSVTGASSTGNAADIPEGVTYVTTNGTYQDGVLTAGSETGDATITAMYNGKAVGEVTINVVQPDKLAFNPAQMIVPYGKTVPLTITATYGLHKVTMKASDVSITLSNSAMGTVNGFSFSACQEASGLTEGAITAVLAADSAISAVADVTFGKGSEVVLDFETGVLNPAWTFKTGYMQYGPGGVNGGANGQNEVGTMQIVTAENGKVHDGEYAIALECDFTQLYETGYHLLNWSNLNIQVPANAQAIGAWIYLPEIEELYSSYVRFVGTTASGTKVQTPLWDTGILYGTEDEGWRYFKLDLSSYNETVTISHMQFYISDRDQSATNYYFKDHASVNSRYTFYLDSITVDYSSAVDDREAPIFDSIKYAEVGMAEGAVLNGQTVTSNVISFSVSVKENTQKNNYTGLNEATAKAYIDGVEVACTMKNGVISIADAVLADGVHTVTFEICDNMGNKTSRTRYITVNAGSGMANVSLVPAAPDATKLLIGSIYWMNLNTTNIEKVQTITMDLNLNSVSQWELDHMVVAEGFSASYEYDYVTNNAVVTVTRTGDVEATGTATLVQLPIRTWESRLTEYFKYEDQTPEKLWARKIIWPMDIKLSMDYGAISYTDGSTGSFSMTPVEVITEIYGNYAELNANGDYANKKSWHIHTAEAVADKAATCTENGYTGRTFCNVCNSVVEWGTTIPATGHTYEVENGVLKCTCGKLFNGEYTDGKTYVDGVSAAGWIEDSYYVDGVKLTGIQIVDGCYYDFGTDGVCAGQVKYTGLVYDEAVQAWRYSKLGELAGGWQQIGENWHYFKNYSKVAATGEYTVNGVTYQFDETGMTKGTWHTDSVGTRYYYSGSYYKAPNPGYQNFVQIDGKTYNFDADGYICVGYHALRPGAFIMLRNVYEFGADGVLVGQYTQQGVITCGDGNMYYIDETGVAPMNLGLVEDNGDYYYVAYSGMIRTNTSMNFTEEMTKGLIDAGWYNIGADGKLVMPDTFTGIREKDGVDYYWVNGEIAKNAGLVQVDGDFYFIVASGKVKKSTSMNFTVEMSKGLIEPGWYRIGADGKLVMPDTFTGIRELDGVDYYWVNGEIAKNAGLVQVDGDFYFIVASGKVKKSTSMNFTVEMSKGLIEPGWYRIGADGKLVMPDTFTGIRELDGVEYYWVNGEIAKNAGVVLVDGDYYYVVASGKLKRSTNMKITEAKANGLIDEGWYTIDADGKIIL